MVTINGVPIDPSIYSKGKKEDQETKTVNKEFRASNLSLSDLVADIIIEPSGSDKIGVELTATQPIIDSIEFECIGDDLRISAKNIRSSYSRRGINISNVFKGSRINGSFVGGDMIVVQGNNIVSHGGNIYISDDGNGAGKAQLVIKAPCGGIISLDGIIGDVKIGKLNCDLEADISSSGAIWAETVGDLSADVSGSGNISVGYVSGDADCDISGSGKINVSSGCINKLKASVSGCGSVEIMATAKTAKLSVSGVGNIHVKHVLSRPKESCSGMGHIRIDSVE